MILFVDGDFFWESCMWFCLWTEITHFFELILFSFCYTLTFLFLFAISISLKVDNVCEWVVEERGRSFGSGNTEMEDYNRKRVVYLLAFLVMLILNAYYCHASAVQVKGNTTLPCNDGLGECLIVEDEWDPYVRRKLASNNYNTFKTNDPDKQVITCGKPKDQYSSCIHKECRKHSSFSRAC